jgi:hypothetical protein
MVRVYLWRVLYGLMVAPILVVQVQDVIYIILYNKYIIIYNILYLYLYIIIIRAKPYLLFGTFFLPTRK